MCNSLFAFANTNQLTPANLAQEFTQSVPAHLKLPPEVVQAYSNNLDKALEDSHVHLLKPQYLVLVDRNPKIQVAIIFFGGGDFQAWSLIGAAPISTGLIGSFDHFLTPLGVFVHSLDNPDFRAEGTKNELGFRGYGIKGMRVYDFGWVNESQGWGKKKMGVMRLQMHATDPDLAEHLLGRPRSKGCIRIPAAMNIFIDRYGLLDAEYDEAIKASSHFWVLHSDRDPAIASGKYLVVIDSDSKIRPDWAQLSKRKYSH